MIKEERLNFIVEELDKRDIVRVSDITKQLDVTDMTIRRDLQDLESRGALIRVHGGAKKVPDTSHNELSHSDKVNVNIEAKEEIAQKIAAEIKTNDTVFLGAGTTIELTHKYLDVDKAKIITNSFYLFNQLKTKPNIELILIGGSFREITGCFVGTIANDFIQGIHVQKAFIGVNGITEQGMYTAHESEGLTQQLVFNNATTRYIIADHSKFNRKDFYHFFTLEEADYIITDNQIDDTLVTHYQSIIEII
ncbi:DeoR/GlpR family DNA-binding transcription regulator [Dolosigranulum savutiense]|uniref:Lactose phosphotransferase system repressor n=1 Tax=Dolosigranulum savutiense TaxID=3110288 RepID=A0AB74TNC5_9LACT